MKISKLLKDVIAVTHVTHPVASTSLIIPETAQDDHKVCTVKAEVKLVGSKCKLPVKIGDIVLVPFHLGNRLKDLVFYDSEDVLAIVESK